MSPILPRYALPPHGRGQRIGLFGGSFDPPHEGHANVAREAVNRLRLDRVWWLISPGNPLKPNPPAPLDTRLAAVERLIGHDPRHWPTTVEAELGTRSTIDLLTALQERCVSLRFVWIMGADNLADFHHWDAWEEIVARVPLAVLARPGLRQAALHSVAARRLRRARLPARNAAQLADHAPPSWCFLNIPMRQTSSSQIRASLTPKALHSKPRMASPVQ